jgi:hypothetical protein
MIIDDLNFMRRSILPDETKPPLIVDPYAVLPNPITFESLQVIAWRHSQIIEPDRRVQHS